MRRSPRSLRPFALGLPILIACCAAPPAPPVAAVLYEAQITEERGEYDLPELHLAGPGIVCNVGSGFHQAPDGKWTFCLFARAFDEKEPRNRTLQGEVRPTTPCEVPADLAAELAELARLHREAEALAERLGPRLAALAPLDYGHELECFLTEFAAARSRGAAPDALAAIERRANAMRDGSEPEHRAARMHTLRGELAALVAK